MSPLRSLLFGLFLLCSWSLDTRADVGLTVGFSDPEFIAYFRQAILARALPGHDDRPGRLTRWTGSVRLVVVNATDTDDEALAPLFAQTELVVDQIRAATGLAIDVIRPSDTEALKRAQAASPAPNVWLVFGIVPVADNFDVTQKRQLDLVVEKQQFVTPCHDALCRSTLMVVVQGGKEILGGALDIDPTDQSYARAAIAEGLLRMLTDAAAVDAAYPSVLGWHRPAPYDRQGLSRMDRLMLRMVYDPRLQPGMSFPEVDALLPALLADAKATD